MAEMTREQAKESGMLGDYAHFFDLDELKKGFVSENDLDEKLENYQNDLDEKLENYLWAGALGQGYLPRLTTCNIGDGGLFETYSNGNKDIPKGINDGIVFRIRDANAGTYFLLFDITNGNLYLSKNTGRGVEWKQVPADNVTNSNFGDVVAPYLRTTFNGSYFRDDSDGIDDLNEATTVGTYVIGKNTKNLPLGRLFYSNSKAMCFVGYGGSAGTGTSGYHKYQIVIGYDVIAVRTYYMLRGEGEWKPWFYYPNNTSGKQIVNTSGKDSATVLIHCVESTTTLVIDITTFSSYLLNGDTLIASCSNVTEGTAVAVSSIVYDSEENEYNVTFETPLAPNNLYALTVTRDI